MIFNDKIKFIPQLRELLSSANNICIVTHANPDGDALGSSLGLYHLLKEHQKSIKVVIPDRVPDFLKWLPGSNEVIVAYDNKELMEMAMAEADLVFCLDFNQLNRVNGVTEALTKTPGKRILIDHHPEPDNDFFLGLSMTSSSSTAELIFEVCEELGLTKNLGKDAASCIYTGIMTDTGSFSYAIGRGRTFEVLAHLIDAGIEKDKIHSLVFDSFSEQRMRLMGYCLKDKMVVISQLRTAYISLSAAEIKLFNHKVGDTEGFVNLPLSISGIVFSVFFSERDGVIKMSLRSRGNFAVNDFAKKYYGGGGHRNAAGGKSLLPLQETIAQFEQYLKEYEAELTNA
ncbi:DHH family phosphoesterase [Williamwhitmania taraxaci]|uniref:Phosphoesterase RecJ domain-containing protein n=1 Tax=Williamwhitmania taraxaci TaxID=1640674 RepID=A0A1G6QE52_9BACT|nr:bifunctional oligoribonuclease/PAP phosphatase NrnA [Williamwhitmania taraxaci]SDC90204.1 phosphoesterase RecJ domain-containing protein [Williamwhitmania taraxaci]